MKNQIRQVATTNHETCSSICQLKRNLSILSLQIVTKWNLANVRKAAAVEREVQLPHRAYASMWVHVWFVLKYSWNIDQVQIRKNLFKKWIDYYMLWACLSLEMIHASCGAMWVTRSGMQGNINHELWYLARPNYLLKNIPGDVTSCRRDMQWIWWARLIYM